MYINLKILKEEIKNAKDKKSKARWKGFYKDYVETGICIPQTYSLSEDIGKNILHKLKLFKKTTIGHPPAITWEEWHIILDKIIYTFTLMDTYEWTPICEEDLIKIQKYEEKVGHREAFGNISEENCRKSVEGFKLFTKYFYSLWW